MARQHTEGDEVLLEWIAHPWDGPGVVVSVSGPDMMEVDTAAWEVGGSPVGSGTLTFVRDHDDIWEQEEIGWRVKITPLKTPDDNPSTMGSDDFVEAVRQKADLGDGFLVTSVYNQFNKKYDSAHITFVNAPKDESGGVVFFNNRLLMLVDGFGPGKNEPPPKGKVKFRLGAAELLPRDMRPRGKTASPERMVDYVAGIITEASKLPTTWPPGSRAANPAPTSASDLVRKLKF